MELSTVLYRVEEDVAVISMNRTKAMNSLNQQIFVDLTTAFEAARDDAAVRCVIFNGEGRCFCAGGDIAEMKGITTEEAFFAFMMHQQGISYHRFRICQGFSAISSQIGTLLRFHT